MERFVQGEEQAFSELFTRHAARLQGALRRIVGAAAEDVLQVAFLSIVRARGRYERGAPFRPWLYTVAINAARDQLRRNRREEPHPTGALPDTAAEPSALPDPGLSRTVEAALAQLPENQREAIVLHRFEGFSFKEIAELLGVTETAVKVRAHRGYQRLRVLLAAERETG